MKGCIAKFLLKYGHPIPKKPQLSPHKHREVIYGAKEQLAPEDDTTPPLDSQGTKRVQGIVGALLYYARALDNKLLVGLSDRSNAAERAIRTFKAPFLSILAGVTPDFLRNLWDLYSHKMNSP